MEKRAYSSPAFLFVVISFLMLSLGVFLLFKGIGIEDHKLILWGFFTIIVGFVIGAIANLMK